MPAAAFSGSVYQKAMRRYEARPTPSHPKNITAKLSPMTRSSIAKTKRFRYEKKRQ